MILVKDAKNLLFNSKEEYLSAKKKWAENVHEAQKQGGGLDYMDHVLYNIVRGLPLEYGYTPITKRSRLDAGHSETQKLDEAKRYLQWCDRSVTMKKNIANRLYRLFGENFNTVLFFESLTFEG